MRRTVDSPVGPLYLRAEDGCLTELMFCPTGTAEDGTDADAAVLDLAAEQLGEYFAGTRRTFDLPLRAKGTPFRKAVWDQLMRIPYGETRTYGALAKALGKPGAARAVGMANHNNPIAVIIPCHRVIGADGTLTGYAGGLEVKRALLALEEHVQV